MKAVTEFFRPAFLGFCASIGCAGLVHAQWQPVTWEGTVSLITTGNVTHADYTWAMTGCEEVNNIGPVIRNGNNFSFDFDIEMETGVFCSMIAFFQSTNVSLGALAPGTYTLTTTSWGVPVETDSFIVPTNSTPPPGSQSVTWEGTVSLVTTGSVTYAEYMWLLLGYKCEYVVSTGPVIRSGNNFSYNFDLAETIGGICPQFIARESTTAALGTLAPGNYTLTTTSWGEPVATNIFTVPTNSTLTLQTIGFAGDGSFNMHLTGVNNVSYVLQYSTNFVDWTSLSTNSVEPPLKDRSPALPGPCYYRVQILDTTAVLGYE